MNRRTFVKGLLSSVAAVPVILQAAPRMITWDDYTWTLPEIEEQNWQYVVRTSIPAPTWRLLYEGVPIREVADLFPETPDWLVEKK